MFVQLVFILNDSCHIIHYPCLVIYFYIEIEHYFEFILKNLIMMDKRTFIGNLLRLFF